MPQKGSVIEEHMVGQDLHVTKPMRFKVSVPCLWNIAIVSIHVLFRKQVVLSFNHLDGLGYWPTAF